MNSGKLCILIAFVLVFLPITTVVHAAITNLNITSEVWINDGSLISISLDCELSSTVSAVVTGNGYYKSITSFIESPASHYAITAKLDNIWESSSPYNITVSCIKNITENVTTSFYVRKLSASVEIVQPATNPAGTIYPYDTIKFKISLLKNSQIVSYDTAFDISIDGKPLEIISILPPSATVSQKWEIEARVPGNLENIYGKPINITATHSNHRVSVLTELVSVKSPLDVNIVEPYLLYPYKLVDAADINLTVSVKHKSKQLGPYDISGFEAKIGERKLTIRKIEYNDPSAWMLFVNIPEMELGNYNLDVYATYDVYTQKSNKPLPIQFLMPFEGMLVDGKNKPINAEMRIKGDNIEEKVLVRGGVYSTALYPGKYTMYLTLPGSRVRFSDVSISYTDELYSATNNIRYDYIEDGIEEINAFKIIAIEFFLPFDEAEIVIPYKDSEINEDRIVVYKCNSWSFGKNECKSEWNEIDAIIDDVKNLVSFKTTELSAFALTTKKSLNLMTSSSKNKYYMGELVVLNGTVEDDEKNLVQGADIKYSNSDLNIFGTATTDSSGEFEISFNAPNKEGSFLLSLSAEKPTYKKDDGKITFSVQKKTSLSISGKSLSMGLDNSSVAKITVSNDGHTEIDGIKISAKGIPDDWFLLSDIFIERLGPNEKKEIDMEITLPKQCDNCKESYIIDIVAESEKASAINTFSLFVTGKEKTEQTEVGQDVLTGFAVSLGTFADEYAIYIIIFAALVLFLVYYRHKKAITGLKDYGESRVPLVKSLHEIKKETLSDNFVYDFEKSNTEKIYNEKQRKDKPKNIRRKNIKSLKNILKNPFV